MAATTGKSNTSGLIRYDPSLDESIFQFQREAYPHRRRDWIAPRWRWMFLESAARMGVEPMVWLYRDNAHVTAHQGAIAVNLQVNGEEQVTGWFVETMALESVRGKTVGPAVIMKAKQDLPFNISLGQTEQMRELQFRLGWRQVAPLETVVLPLRTRRVLANKFNPVMRGIVGAGLGITGMLKRLWRKPTAVSVREIDHFDDRHNRLWNSIKDGYRCAVVRDASYLNWKYVTQPGQDFTRLELSRDGNLVAVVVLAFNKPDSVYPYCRAHLVDLVVSPSDRALLDAVFEVVRKTCRNKGADAVVFHVINKQLEVAARAALGFLRREATRVLLVCPGHRSEEVNNAVLNPENWLVTMGDSDIDRPW